METPVSVFPLVEARSLEGQVYHLPADLGGELNVVQVAFERWHQVLVDSWVPWLEALMRHYPGVRTYEVPVISHLYLIARPFIDGGMAAHIHRQAIRERTLTVYTHRNRFLDALQLSHETMTSLLVDRAGRVYWRAHGAYNPHAAQELIQLLESEPLTSRAYSWA